MIVFWSMLVGAGIMLVGVIFGVVIQKQNSQGGAVIADIVLTWNELTATLLAWLVCVSLAVAADVGPEVYREKTRERKARAQLRETVKMLAEKKTNSVFDPDNTMQLGVFHIQSMPERRRHARA